MWKASPCSSVERCARALLPALLICHAPHGGASAIASGRHWQIAIDSIECEAAESRLTIGARIRYLGPKGIVEAPVSRLVDDGGKPFVPKSLVWKGGSKELAAWLSIGGMRNVQADTSGALQLRFDVRDATGSLKLEFGDIQAFSLTRAGASAGQGLCKSILPPGRIQATRRPPPARAEGAKSGIRVYRSAYPCVPKSRGAWRTTEAEFPPYLPEQLLVFGRGYLPNARQIELPMGRAAAQTYAYAGPDNPRAVEEAARRAILSDFPEHRSGLASRPLRLFAFNWGVQKAASGNDLYSVGIYAVRPCPN